jgi:hypothetical protein
MGDFIEEYGEEIGFEAGLETEAEEVKKESENWVPNLGLRSNQKIVIQADGRERYQVGRWTVKGGR